MVTLGSCVSYRHLDVVIVVMVVVVVVAGRIGLQSYRRAS